MLKQVVQTNSVCQSVSESEIHIFSSTAVRISRGTLCHLIGGYTKHSQIKREFVQTTGQAVMCASQWLKLEHCSSASWRLHSPILPASVFLAIFNLSGKTPVEKDSLITVARRGEMKGFSIFKRLQGILYGPIDLPFLSSDIILDNCKLQGSAAR